MKNSLLSIFIFLVHSFSYSQNLTVSSYQLNGISGVQQSYLLANESIVIVSGGIFNFTDSINNVQINLPGDLEGKGRGNRLISSDGDTLFVWENGQVQKYYDPNANTSISVQKITQLSDGKLLIVNRSGGITVDLVVYDTNTYQFIPTSTNTGFVLNDIDIVEFDQNKYFCSFLQTEDLSLIYDVNTNSLTEYNDSVFIGNNFLLGYDKGPEGSLRFIYDDGIVRFRNDSILNISYFQPAGITFDYSLNGNRFATTQDGQYLARIEANQLVIYDGNSFTRYDTTQGVPANGFYRMATFNSTNELIAVESTGEVHTFRIPLVTGIINNLLEHQISISPNPAKDYIRIESPSMKIEKAELLDLIGKNLVLKRKNTDSSSPAFDIPERIDAGLYILKLTGNNGESITRRLIIQR